MSPNLRRLAALLPILGATALARSQDAAPPTEPDAPPAQDAPAAAPANPLDPLEDLALEAQRAAGAALVSPLLALELEGFAERLAPGFEGRFPVPGSGTAVDAPGGSIALERYSGAQLGTLDAHGFEQAVAAAVAGWTAVERARFAFTRFAPEADGSGARALARFMVGGCDASGARAELHGMLELELEFTLEPRQWTVASAHFQEGHRASSPAPRFADVSDPTGFHLNLSPSSQRLQRELVDERALWTLGGVSALDWNADGRPDLVAARRDQIACLFVNDGRGGFRREPLPIESERALGACFLFLDLDGDGLEELVPGALTGQSGGKAWLGIFTRRDGAWVHLPRALEIALEGRARNPLVQTIVPADVDRDGQLDLFVGVERDSRSSGGFATPLGAFDGGADLLFMNRGGLAFSEEAAARGLVARQYTTAALAFDPDRDRDPDLFVATSYGPDWLLENDGKGQFSPRLDVPLSAYASIAGGIATSTLDGAPALLVTNPYSPAGARVAAAVPAAPDDELHAQELSLSGGSRLFLLDEASGAWRERSAERGVSDAGFAFGPVFTDLDGDGDQDLFVANGITTHSDPSLPDFERLLWRQVAAEAIALKGGRPRVLADPELLATFRGSFAGGQRERAFVCAGGELERFYEAGYALGLDLLQDGRSAVALDFDGDGDQDLATLDLHGLRLLENRGPRERFARVRLDADASAVIGARIELTAGGRTQARVVQATSGHASQVLLEQHFGLGDAERIERIAVAWAWGEGGTWTDLPADRRLTLVRGKPEALVEELPAWPAPVRAGAPLRMTMKLPRLGGEPGALASTGRPAVIACWAPENAASLALLVQLAELDAEHAGRVRVAGVCVDGEDPAPARAAAAASGAGFEQFRASPEFTATWLGERAAAELPAAFVFDAAGELRRALTGEVDVVTVRAVVASLLDDDVFVADLVRKADWLILEGKLPAALDCLIQAVRGDPRHAGAHEAIGKLYVLHGDMQKAEVAFGRAVSFDPELGEAQYNLGAARMELGMVEQAVVAFEAAWHVRGDHLETIVALGSAYVASERVPDGLAAFEKARALAPEDATVEYLCGRALADLGRTDEARAAFERALVLAPEFAAARGALEALGN